MIYLDWNATTPPHPDAIDAMRRALETAWANPASVHGAGRRARAHVEQAREAVAQLVGLDARDVVLTSGGTEANNLALAHAFPREGPQGSLVLSRLEHPSVVRAAERLSAEGVVVEWAPPDASGRLDPASVAEACDRAAARAPLRLVVLQAVNHETGVIQPVAAVADLAHARGAKLHVDAVQAVGRLDPSVWAGADLVTVAAHKIRGPKGVGALATQPGIRLRPVLLGGAQERGLRPGTQDPAACAGFAAAAERAREAPARYAALAALRDTFEAALIALGARHGQPPARNGDAPRAPHVSNLSWPGWRGDELCAALDLEGVAVSSGSACSAGTAEPSPVLTAMLGEPRARGAVRVSLGEETTGEALAEALQRWERVLERQRAA
ncbi:Cysteine desulfurase [Minicystis rosea]|nr:Cysteine desulfurase [Minicystis rosea]